MSKDYKGWSLFDKVLIVAKKDVVYDHAIGKSTPTGDYIGYVVDPTNTKMRENALAWAKTSIWEYDENKKFTGRYTTVEGEEFLYDNQGFTLELKDSAGASSQGGKLSFWNCWITASDGKKFRIGIAADLLLDVLKSSTFINGVCQTPLCFARQKNGVGMLHESMQSYQEALGDMKKKEIVKTKKTSKHIIGHVYSTLCENNMFAGEVWQWYEPVYKTVDGWMSSYRQLSGYRRLAEPIRLLWFPTVYNFEAGKQYKMSKLGMSTWELKDKLPARVDSGYCLDTDITVAEVIESCWRKEVVENYNERIAKGKSWTCYDYYPIGYGADKDSYELPEELRKILIASGYTIED